MAKEYKKFIVMNPITFFETLHEFKKMSREIIGTGKGVTVYPNGKIVFRDQKVRDHFDEKCVRTDNGLLSLNGSHYIEED